MHCPFCDSLQSKVVDKRTVAGRGEIRRRRECLHCSKRFTTYEQLAHLSLQVIKKDGKREPFSTEKLKTGILKALQKRPGIDRAQRVVDKIEGRIRVRGLKEVPSVTLGKWVLSELKRIDGVAYLRFASVYRDFGNPKDFLSELKSLP